MRPEERGGGAPHTRRGEVSRGNFVCPTSSSSSFLLLGLPWGQFNFSAYSVSPFLDPFSYRRRGKKPLPSLAESFLRVGGGGFSSQIASHSLKACDFFYLSWLNNRGPSKPVRRLEVSSPTQCPFPRGRKKQRNRRKGRGRFEGVIECRWKLDMAAGLFLRKQCRTVVQFF